MRLNHLIYSPITFHTYIAVIDTNKQVTVIQKDEVVLNAELQNEQLHGKIEYDRQAQVGKLRKLLIVKCSLV